MSAFVEKEFDKVRKQWEESNANHSFTFYFKLVSTNLSFFLLHVLSDKETKKILSLRIASSYSLNGQS